MASKYTIHSWPSIIGGTLAVIGASSLLIVDGWRHGFTLEHALAPLCVGLAVLAAKEGMRALKDGKLLSVLGLALVACFGSGLIVYQSMGRQAATRDAQTVVAADQMQSRDMIKAELATIQQTLSWAMPDMMKECQGAPEPLPANGWPKCRSNRASVKAFEKQVGDLKKDLEAKPPVAVDPRADRIAGVATILGATMGADAIKALVALFEPFALPLFLELSAIFMFGFGVRHVTETGVVLPASAVSFDVPAVKAVDFMERPPVKDLEEAKKYFTLSEDEAIIVEALRARGGKADRQGDLAEEVGCHPAELSKRVQACRPEAVMWQKVGRNKVLTLGSMVAGHA
jgi:hypothetical protein